MARSGLVLRLVIAAAAVGSMGVLCTSGPDCGQACSIVENCPGLNKTFYLSCSSLGFACVNATPDNFGLASCASCIDDPSTTCAGLIAGVCDPECVPGFMPPDAGSPDAGMTDGGPPDAGLADGGTSDAGTT